MLIGIANSHEHYSVSVLQREVGPHTDAEIVAHLAHNFHFDHTPFFLASEETIQHDSRKIIENKEKSILAYQNNVLTELAEVTLHLHPDQLENYQQQKSQEIEQELYEAALEILEKMSDQE